MDIGTGKDQPEDTPIHLIDLITPNQKFSVADFQKIGLKTIKEIQSRGKLPILVGCSGFYIDALINSNYNTFSIKPNKVWRFVSQLLSVKTLQKIYKFLDKNNFSKLNNSDINNHYRLTRKIEIQLFSSKNIENCKSNIENFDILHISLTAPMEYLYKRIDNRVQRRIDLGFFDEIKELLKKYKWSDPGMQIAAYFCLKPYFKNSTKEVLKDCLQKWSYAEHSDARRQSCWFKGRKNTNFFDITKKDFQSKIFKLITKWYT
jgi:tRNA dimethylallyltransferase